MKKLLTILVFLGLIELLTSCSAKNEEATASGGYDAGNPAAIIDLISDGVAAAGGGMSANGGQSLGTKKVTALMDSSVCDVHGYPTGISDSDPNYPGYLTYCFMTINSGDTVVGGFSLPKSLACFLTDAGVAFDGVARDYTFDGASPCWEEGQGGQGENITATITGSAPAAFNSNYQKGVVISATGVGLTFKMAANVDGDDISFVTQEEWTDGSAGATSGSINTSTGLLHYESRVERFGCSTASRCGWNRHTRIVAELTMSGGAPSGLENISFAYSNIQKTPAQSSLGGTLITASGAIATGVKARLFQATNGSGSAPASLSDYDVVANWVEVSNSKCYTQTSESGTGCDAGLDKFAGNTKFLLQQTGYTSYSDWFSALTGAMSFTAVDVSTDVQ